MRQSMLTVLALVLSTGVLYAQEAKVGSARLARDIALASEQREEFFTYGLRVSPPWADGGYLLLNFPEHLPYGRRASSIIDYDDQAYAIWCSKCGKPTLFMGNATAKTVHCTVCGKESPLLNTARPENLWQVAADGLSGKLDVNSVSTPGVHVGMTAKVTGPRVDFTLDLTNGTTTDLNNLMILLCHHYRHLTGFPQWKGNLEKCFAVIDGKIVKLTDLPTPKPECHIKAATAKGSPVSNAEWAANKGGYSETRVDLALGVVQALTGERKIVVAWWPGERILANGNIPCIHGDPYLGDLAAGKSLHVQGFILFTEGSVDEVVAQTLALQKAAVAKIPEWKN